MTASADGEMILTRGTIVIDVEACKGCDLCIDACRPGVLAMTVHERNGRGYRYPRLVEAGCTACRACAQICPDFVFQVWKFDEPVRVSAGSAPDFTSEVTA
jgi:2-oxoglutarate ferredoxin oxidoreductase subunit delta